jgi:hypothetical protein
MEGVQKDPAVSHADVVVYRVLLLEDAMSQKPESVSLIPMIDDPVDGQRELAALMAALRGTDDATVAQAMLIEQHPRTRTSMRLVLDALGRPWSDDDPSEFAWRALRQENDRLWHPPILTRLVAGDPSLLEPLLKSAASNDPIDRAVSWTLLRRFLPGWIEQDQSSEVDVLQEDVFYQQLLARWYLQRRFLEQDRSGHYITPTGL